MSYRRLIICTDSAAGGSVAATAAERDAITKLLTSNGWQVWHWFQDLWLVTVPAGQLTDLGTIRMAVKGIMADPARHVLVLDGDGGGYNGHGDPRGWPWMADNWRSTPPEANQPATAGNQTAAGPARV